MEQSAGTDTHASKRDGRRQVSPATRGREILLRLLPIVGFIAAWWILTATLFTQARVYPSPADVLGALLRILSGESPLGSTYVHALATLFRLVTAFVVAFIGGTLLGVLAGRRKVVFDFLINLVWIAMAVPSIVWVFIFVIAFGISNAVPITALVVLLSAPTILAIAEGTKSIPNELVTMAR